jgi:hypothetical protein
VITESYPKYAILLDSLLDIFQFVILPMQPIRAVQKHLAYFSVVYIVVDLSHSGKKIQVRIHKNEFDRVG